MTDAKVTPANAERSRLPQELPRPAFKLANQAARRDDCMESDATSIGRTMAG